MLHSESRHLYIVDTESVLDFGVEEFADKILRA